MSLSFVKLKTNGLKPVCTGTIYGEPDWQLDSCPICLEPLNTGSLAIPVCKRQHAYHVDCIESWIPNGGAKCPECKVIYFFDVTKDPFL